MRAETTPPAHPPELAAAYAHCREVARREAKNFYWSFRALPRHKSDAMCAMYAFMRRADDLSDDETLSLEARREAMRGWTEAWRQSRVAGVADPLFLAVNDTQRRFAIPDELLEDLVAGTTLDLQPVPEGVVLIEAGGRTLQVYETFEDLYRYCYLVASVVGLVTIRIFGYSDPAADLLAERTGVAFQLTNILRDVREDMERGRIYLPLDCLREASVSLEMLRTAADGGAVTPALRRLLGREAERAAMYYTAGDRLLPTIDRDARPAMRVLISIYRRLLHRVAADPAAVFGQRISVPTPEKLAVLVRGLGGSLLARRP